MSMIAITGQEFFGKRIASELKQKKIKADYVSLPKNIFNLKSKFNSYSIVHFVGSPTISRNLVNLILLKLNGKKILVNWIGYDVRRIKYSRIRKIMGSIGNIFVDMNIATAKNLVEDLASNGIKSKYQPIPVYSIYQMEEIPKEKRVAVYLPDNYSHFSEFYQEDIIKKLIKNFPEIEFLILNNSGKNFPEKNVRCFNWVEDMGQIYKKVKVIIRLPLEDGTSGTIIEALSMGRYMIASNTLLPYCKLIQNYEEAKQSLIHCIEKTKPNEEGSKYVKEHFSSEILTGNLVEIYDSILNKKIK